MPRVSGPETGPAPPSLSGTSPMLPTLVARPPEGDGWAFEVKWDGVRALARIHGGGIQLSSRTGNDITTQYPELCWLDGRQPADALLDGEIVAFSEDGKPDFERLQHRMGVTDPRQAEARSAREPVTMMVFDVLWVAGRSTVGLPYVQRRELLSRLTLPSDLWRLSEYHVGEGPALLEASRTAGLEGLVAKRLDSVYEPGRRTRTWLKIKNTLSQEFVVVGYTPGEGAREGTIGALLLGYNDRPGGELRYAGKVGTGFSDDLLKELLLALEADAVPVPMFAGTRIPRFSRFVTPRLVVQVAFSEWTSGGMIRHPSFKGFRTDKQADEIVREVAV